MSIYSSQAQLERMRRILVNYVRLPFSARTIPGSLMESILAHTHGGRALNTYDFVDVIREDTGCGWQVKSTRASTPVTWKRAKIPNAQEMIEASRESDVGLQELGDAIIEFCNDHARASLARYELDQIGYARIVLHRDRRATYFERMLCSHDSPAIFDPKDFVWQWSEPKTTSKKEQLPALHGTHIATERKWWAWHGLGENQLHFSGESAWWPQGNDPHCFVFELPPADARLSFDQFIGLFDA